MIRPDQIPDEVVEVLTMLLLGHSLNNKNVSLAIAAALNAWPGIDIDDEVYGNAPDAGPLIILPLPQKDGDK